LTVGNLGSIEIQKVAPDSVDALLSWIHSEANESELAGILSEYRFRQQIGWLPSPLELSNNGQRVAAVYFTCLPGDLAMLGGVRAMGGVEGVAVDLIRKQVETIRAKLPRVHFQATIGDTDQKTQELVAAAGFLPLATVNQLWCGLADDSITDPQHERTNASSDLSWFATTELCKSRFIKLLEATFRETLDCPELNAIRTNEQVVDSFLMNRSVRLCPNWYALCHQQQLAGCLLLQQHNRELVELVYMGLIPEARKRGLGKQILAIAKSLAFEMGAAMLVLAVDVRNTPAIRTYTKNGFQHHRKIQVYWC
jgi:ribosomal protein S18 acetylase RimI-like enzyme